MRNPAQKIRRMTAAEKAREEAEFVERIEEGWLRSAIVRILRIEDKWSKVSKTCDTNEMPEWVAVLFQQLLNIFGGASVGHRNIGIESFGKILGEKVCFTSGLERLFKHRERTDDATRAQITKMLGGPSGVMRMEKFRNLHREVDELAKKVLKTRVPKLTVEEQGRFYRGYGRGLLSSRQMSRMAREKGKVFNAQAYKTAFAVMNWQKLETLAEAGGWPAVCEFFTTQLPNGVHINEDGFVKMLQLAGMRSGQRAGRPRKSGKQSSPDSKF